MKISRVSRGKFWIVSLLVLAAGVAGVSLLLGGPDRFVVFGKADPATGIRCRFTISSAWERKVTLDATGVPVKWQRNSDIFVPPRPRSRRQSLQRWIDTYLLHRSPAKLPLPGIPLVSVSTYSGNDWPKTLSNVVQIKAGFPEPVPPYGTEIVSQRHLTIDGCAASIVNTNRLPPDRPSLKTDLYVYVPARATLYTVRGIPGPTIDDRGNPIPPGHDPYPREIQEVIASFHLEKVAPP